MREKKVKNLKTAYFTAVIMLIHLSSSITGIEIDPDIALDIGNDGIYEWTQRHDFIGPERTRNLASDVDRIVAAGCVCDGCSLSGSGGYCIIPVKFRSKYSGILNIEDIDISYHSSTIIANVSYGENFRNARGDCWYIQDPAKTELYKIPPDVQCSINHPKFTSAVHTYPGSYDAIDDAVWRLLNETMDEDNNWIVDHTINNNMSIQAQGLIGVQSLWGPAKMRLIVWV
ncbi:MAG: hypothetical protein ABIH11_07625 [Candidatus Altiarchaeota archaeon]